MPRPRFGSLFSGVGGFDLGLEAAGWECAFQVEIDPFCQRVLAHRWPGVRRTADVRSLESESDGGDCAHAPVRGGRGTAEHAPCPDPGGAAGLRRLQPHDESDDADDRRGAAGDLPPLDLLVGGFPCQDLSVAGKRAGLGGERSGLFWEIIRIAGALRPRWLLLENVPGLLSSCSCRGCAVLTRFLRRHRSRGCLGCPSCLAAEERREAHHGSDLAVVCAALANLGYHVGYRILDSQFLGVAQRRRRVFLVVGPTEAGVSAVLALTEGRGGHPQAGDDAGAGPAGTLTGGAGGTRSHGKPSGSNDGSRVVLARALTAPQSTSRLDADSETFITGTLGGGNYGAGRRSEDDPNLVITGGVQQDQFIRPAGKAPTLSHASNTHGGHHQPMVFDTTQVSSPDNYSNPQPGDPCHPLAEGMHPPLLVAAQLLAAGPPGTRREDEASLVVGPLMAEHDASEDGSGRGTPLMVEEEPAIAFTERGRPQGRTLETQEELAYALLNPADGGRSAERQVSHGSLVRRLTPIECEKLQAFPPGWTCLCTPWEAYMQDEDAAALACSCPDSPRYRALGNAVTVSVIRWLGERLLEQEALHRL